MNTNQKINENSTQQNKVQIEDYNPMDPFSPNAIEEYLNLVYPTDASKKKQ